VKAKKLEEDQILRIRDRFDFVLEAAEAEAMRGLLRRLAATGERVTGDDLAALERGARERAAELDEAFDAVRHANEPTVLPDERAARLKALLSQSWRDRHGRTATLLLPEEFRFLAIPQGSLSPEERTSIESHVADSWRFLSSIPWTPDLARVPDIAYGHTRSWTGPGIRGASTGPGSRSRPGR